MIFPPLTLHSPSFLPFPESFLNLLPIIFFYLCFALLYFNCPSSSSIPFLLQFVSCPPFLSLSSFSPQPLPSPISPSSSITLPIFSLLLNFLLLFPYSSPFSYFIASLVLIFLLLFHSFPSLILSSTPFRYSPPPPPPLLHYLPRSHFSSLLPFFPFPYSLLNHLPLFPSTFPYPYFITPSSSFSSPPPFFSFSHPLIIFALSPALSISLLPLSVQILLCRGEREKKTSINLTFPCH